MKAVVFTGKGKIEVQDIPKPVTPPDEIMVKIEYCALCATDVHLVDNGLFGVNQPLILGHEMSGTVVEIGETAAKESDFQIGDHVTANPVPFCGTCAHCRKGQYAHCENAAFDPSKRPMDAMAEYRSYHPRQLYRVPDDVPFQHACLVEPITTASRGMELADMPLGSTVCLSGAGSIGLIMLNLVKYRGGTRITVIEPVAEKRKLALEMGAQYVIDPAAQDVVQEGMRITDGLGYDFVFEMSGVPRAGELCPSLVAHCGCVEYFALYPEDYRLPLNLTEMFNKEARIQCTFTNPFLYPKSIDLLQRLDMDRLAGPVYDITDAPQAFADFKTAKYPKLLIHCAQDN